MPPSAYSGNGEKKGIQGSVYDIKYKNNELHFHFDEIFFCCFLTLIGAGSGFWRET